LTNAHLCADEDINILASQDFPSTIALLTAGGDARIVLSADLARNKYGCAPMPDVALISFSSSTASTISSAGFSAADALRNKLAIAIEQELPEVVYARELNRIKLELLRLCDLDHMLNLELVFAASGTDLHLIVAQLCAGSNDKTALAIMPDALETGSGVCAALAARHFSSRSALGEDVTAGNAIEGMMAVDVAAVAIRLADGSLRAEAAIDAEVEALVDHAANLGQPVLIIMVDTSKTGLISPSPACAIKLKQRYPHLVNILVDACQFRMSAATLNAYLEQGFMVMITGSKFLSGPSFSAALLIPDKLAAKLSSHPLALGMRAYSSSVEWPTHFAAATRLRNVANFGLLLRWQAALVELHQFKLVPDKQIEDFCQRFASAIQNRLDGDQHFAFMSVRPLTRSGLILSECWDNVQTIFSFVLLDRRGKPLNHEDTLTLYQWLQLGSGDRKVLASDSVQANSEVFRCQLGQPVIYARHHEYDVSALRLCLSARLIVEAARNKESAQQVIQRALSVLDNLVRLLETL
jgi:hypothetical protein